MVRGGDGHLEDLVLRGNGGLEGVIIVAAVRFGFLQQTFENGDGGSDELKLCVVGTGGDTDAKSYTEGIRSAAADWTPRAL